MGGILFFIANLNKESELDDVSAEIPVYEFHCDKNYKYYLADLNETHLKAAQSGGIEPLESRGDTLDAVGKIIKISSCDTYKVSQLYHSVPYLIPPAVELLNKIGSDFRDSLLIEGYQPHRIIVTSVLRTNEDVKRLMRVNYNASLNSAHCYGTTFDISYYRFDSTCSMGNHIYGSQMESILGKILARLRYEGRCYVKLEKKQRCFHVTCRHYDSLQRFTPQAPYLDNNKSN